MYYIIFIIIIMLMILFMIIMCVHVCTCMYVCMYIMYFPRGSFCVINVCPSNVVKIKSLASLVSEKLSVYSTHLCNLSGTCLKGVEKKTSPEQSILILYD